MMQNMGPSIYYMEATQKDPIPFTLRLGTSYTAVQTPIHELTFLLDLDREVVKNYNNGNPDPFYTAIWTDLLHDQDESIKSELTQIVEHFGLEYWYSHFLALRTGLMTDPAGQRYELTFGLGLNYGNMNFDWSYIYSPQGFLANVAKAIDPQQEGSSGARDGQMRFSFLFRL